MHNTLLSMQMKAISSREGICLNGRKEFPSLYAWGLEDEHFHSSLDVCSFSFSHTSSHKSLHFFTHYFSLYLTRGLAARVVEMETSSLLSIRWLFKWLHYNVIHYLKRRSSFNFLRHPFPSFTACFHGRKRFSTKNGNINKHFYWF